MAPVSRRIKIRLMRHYEVDWPVEGGTLHAQRWEPDEPVAGAVALVHGLGEHSGRYQHVAVALGAAGFALCSFDLRGHGRSTGRRGDTRLAAAMGDIDRLLADTGARFPGTPLFLYGHSLGGLLVLRYALEHAPGVAGVVATGPALRSPLREQRAKVFAVRLLAPVLPSLTLPTGLDPEGISHDPAAVAAYRSDPLVHGRASIGFARDAIEAGDAALAAAGRWSLPLLLVHGGADPITDPAGSRQFAAAAGGRCHLIVYDGLYHEVHNEAGARVLPDIVDWITDQAAR